MAAESRDGETKKDIAVMALGVVGYLAHRHGDVVGLVYGDRNGTRSIPAKAGEPHLERLLREVDSSTSLYSGPSRIEDQLEYVARNVKGRFLLFVVSDEHAAGPTPNSCCAGCVPSMKSFGSPSGTLTWPGKETPGRTPSAWQTRRCCQHTWQPPRQSRRPMPRQRGNGTPPGRSCSAAPALPKDT
ncbi:conserved hypothetical protein [Arthrobacter sp. Hiyo4]|nr:conserved hypothetical protein [Arthrobacter sp. Hiyo4]